MLTLAWKFIRYDRAKSIGIVTAIVISIFLVGQQLSLLNFLMGLMGNLIGNAPLQQNKIWVIERQSNNINILNSIDQRFVQEIGSIPGIERTFSVVVAPVQVSFADGKTANVTLIGSTAPWFPMGPRAEKIAAGQPQNLISPYTVSVEYYNAKNWETTFELGKQLEVNGKTAQIGLITKNAQGFGSNLMYSDVLNVRQFANIPEDRVHIIIVEVASDAMKKKIIDQIDQLFPTLRAWDPEKLQQSTVKAILISSNMGMSFGALILFALISGFFIIGLTLYSSALDRIKDYGILKAIGARNRYVTLLIIAQAFLYALIGYSIALLLLFGFKMGVVNSGLNIHISFYFAFALLLMTLLIAIGGALFALLRIRKLEPASVF